MHKIKEMLHKDDDSKSDSKHSGDSHSHSHGDSHSHSGDSHSHSHSSESHSHSHGGKIEEGHLSTKEFKNDHIKHGEIEHGGHQHVHSTTTTTHTHTHTGGEHHHAEMKHSGEKHVFHEREVVKGGDLYREGSDPTHNREVVTECRHDSGTDRTRVAEGEIVKEKIKEVELHKVQPVIHREREQKEIRHVVEPHQQFEVKDTKILHKEKDIDLGTRREASTLETSRGTQAPVIESSREHLGTERQHQELPMRVEEHVHKKVEEHVHPVIYKETLVPKVTEETHHIYETVKEKPIETYEVKEIHGSRSTGMHEAERSFFSEHTSRGIDVDMHKGCTHKHGEVCSLETERHKSCTHKHGETCHLDRGVTETHSHSHGHDHGHTHTHGGATHTHHHETLASQPVVGHSQNIGAHHVAGAVPAGHNTAYDAALCNECTGNKVCSHGERDAALMQKMNEKKIDQDKAAEKKHDK